MFKSLFMVMVAEYKRIRELDIDEANQQTRTVQPG
jgi:hypothetical protein